MADSSSFTNDLCTACSKGQSIEGKPLQKCSGCHTTLYCSKECQKADWKTHKTTCSGRTSKNNSEPTKPAQHPHFSKAGIEAHLGFKAKTFLQGLTPAEVYPTLIDSYRMRTEDEYVFAQYINNDSLYGQGDPTIGFRQFLKMAETRKGILPTWWDAEEREKCIAKGNEKEPWSSLHFAVEKHDIQEHYKNSTMPMQLRMLAEEITGTNVQNEDATDWHRKKFT